MKKIMLKNLSSALQGIKSGKAGYISKRLDYILKNLRKRFDTEIDLEKERSFVHESSRELASDLKTGRLGLNSKPDCGYLTF